MAHPNDPPSRQPQGQPPLVGGTARRNPDDRRHSLRTLVRSFRAAITAEERMSASAQAVHRLVPVLDAIRSDLAPEQSQSPVVALSMPVDGEIDVTAAAALLRADGWTVVLPAVLDDRAMEFREWLADDDLVRGRFRIPEPAGGAALVPHVVVAPCVAVDGSGNRLGFGKGFYDRALGAVPDAVAIGVVFDEQVVAAVPAEPWDVPLDLVVTPTRVMQRDL